MESCDPVTIINHINPAPLYQLANLLWGYGFGLITTVPLAALWRWLH